MFAISYMFTKNEKKRFQATLGHFQDEFPSQSFCPDADRNDILSNGVYRFICSLIDDLLLRIFPLSFLCSNNDSFF